MGSSAQKLYRRWALCALACALQWAADLRATVAPTDEYSKLIGSASGVSPLDSHPFGENVDLYTGALSFGITDISVPGIGPTITVGRTLKAAEDSADATDAVYGGGNWRPFGEWDLDIPRIETNAAYAPNLNGWQTDNNTVPTASNRCTVFRAPPPAVSTSPPDGPWDPVRWWYGYHLVVAGYGDQLLLSRTVSNTHAPTSGSYPIVTKQDWMIGCGITASDGGEGFLALSPEGTQYTFAHLVYRPMPALTRPNGSTGQLVGPQPESNDVDFIARDSAAMYVTKIQDRFGNTLTYNWSGNNLTSIVASDGRQVNFTYVSGKQWIQTITQQAADTPVRTWTYSYNGNPSFPSLTRVQLPDGSAWSYQMGTLESTSISTTGGSCVNNTLPILNSVATTGSMTSPTGLSATFTITPTLRGRSYVPKSCWSPYSGSTTTYATVPNSYYQFAITSAVYSGPGLPTQTWNWGYSAANQSWSSDACASGQTCPSTIYTDVVDPSGHDVRYTFSNRYDASESLLVGKTEYSGAAGTTVLRSETDTYATTGGTWPHGYGDDLQLRLNQASIENVSPLSSRTITQAGATFTFTANTYDAYARTTKQTESSTLGFSRTVSTAYFDDGARWVLGQVSTTAVNATASLCTTTNVTTTSFSTCTLYDGTTDLPSKEYNFGLLQSTKTWNANGTLYTVADGRSDTTTMTNWKRGVPQSIKFADNTTRSAVVNDDGWVASVTDENGYTTGYAYDAMGRITKITYPAGDSVNWNTANSSFAQISSTEYGLVTGHWKLTQTTGNYRKQTFFDARWRPVLTREEDIGNSATIRYIAQGYDYANRMTFSSYPVASATSYTSPTSGTHSIYDALGRVTSQSQDSELGTLTTSTGYLSGFQKQVTNPRNYTTTTSYQAFALPDESAPTQIQAPESATTAIGRDTYGKPTSIVRSGAGYSATRSFVYDANQRMCKTIEPESGAMLMDYDAANNIAWSTRGSSLTGLTCDRTSVAATDKTTYAYDFRNRLTGATYPTGTSALSQTWTPDGLLLTTSTNGAVWTYGYNKRRLLQSESLVYGGQTFALSRGYDANGHQSSLTYPDNLVAGYLPNAMGQATLAGSYASGVTYYPNGAMSGFHYGNSVAHTLTQNARGLPQRSQDGAVTDLTYSYDKNANVAQIADNLGNTTTRTLGYDGLDRLSSASAPSMWGNASYTYDTLDNLRTSTLGSRSCTYAINSNNRITGLSGAGCAMTYGYDARGNVTQRGAQTFTFDRADRLASVTGLESSVYDGHNRRVAILRNAGTKLYQVYSEDGQLVYGWDTTTNKKTDYIYLNGSLIARSESVNGSAATPTYIHTDGLHSPVAETNTIGNVTQQIRYEPYGGAWGSSATQGPGYTGQVTDTSTGLSYMQQRYYDFLAGRFLSNDPAGVDAASFNRYWYADNNPYKYIDRDGRESGCFSNNFGCGIGHDTPETIRDQAVAMAGFATLMTGGLFAPELAGGGMVAATTKALLGIGGKKVTAAEANKVAHIFGQAKHGLDGVAKAMGGEAKALQAIEKATVKAVDASKDGVFKTVVNVGGQEVTVTGKIVAGEVKVGTAYIPPPPPPPPSAPLPPKL
jgi:RHS repeat-associated protein